MTATAAQKKWIKIIHTAKRELHLDDEAYRAVLAGSAGVASSTEIIRWDQYEAVMTAFRVLGFSGRNAKRTDDGIRSPEMITARQEYYIRGLWELASRKKDEESLRSVCRKITGRDDVRFCRKKDATKLILAMRKIAEDAGFDPDRHGERPD